MFKTMLKEKELGSMKTLFMIGMCVMFAVSMASVVSAQDVDLTGTDHLNVDSTYGKINMYDESTANVLPGAVIQNWMYLFNDSEAWVYDGQFGVGGSGGSFRTYDNSVGHIYGGNFPNWYSMLATNSSTMNIAGGSFDGSLAQLRIFQNATVNISGGAFTGDNAVIANDMSTLNISGGSVSQVSSVAFGNIYFYGYDFVASGGLIIDGTTVQGTGTLSGKWFDHTPFTTVITGNEFDQIHVVPEPGSMLVLATGLAGLGGFALRRRK